MRLEFKIVDSISIERLLFRCATVLMLFAIGWLIISKQGLATGLPIYLAVVSCIGVLVAISRAASGYSKTHVLTLVAASLVPALVIARLLS